MRAHRPVPFTSDLPTYVVGMGPLRSLSSGYYRWSSKQQSKIRFVHPLSFFRILDATLRQHNKATDDAHVV